MSNSNCESSTNFADPSGERSCATTSALSGLDTIILAMQALKKEPRHQVDAEKSTIPTTNIPATTSTNSPPIPNGIHSARRVVSTDTIGDSDTDSTPVEHPPQGKEEETVSTLEKPLDTTRSAPLESGTSSGARSSPLSSSEATTNDIPPSTDDNAKAADFTHILTDPEGWLKKTDNLFAKLPPIDRNSDEEIVVQPNDVLCGRGGETNHHPGNIRYRSLVKAYQKLYLLAKRRDKPKIAQCIVVSVRGVDGRFLKRTKNANNGSAWVDVGNVKAREKTSQALREGAPNLRENVSPTVAGTSSNESTAAPNARQILVPDQAEKIALPPPSNPTLVTSNATPFQPMVGWKWQEAAKGSGQPVPTVSSSAIPHASSSPSAPPSEADNEAYMKIFTKAAAQLMQHPAFHQLDPARQYEAILYECKNARAAVESAKRSPTGNPTAANGHVQGRTSPMNPTVATQQQQVPQAPQHNYPTQEWQKYPYNNHYPVAPSVVKSVDLRSVYCDLLSAKAAAATGLGSGLPSAIKKEEKPTSDEEQQTKSKKRSVPSTSPSMRSVSSSNAAVVSDTGSDTSSSTSSYEFPSTSRIAVKEEKTEAVTSVSRGGSRLKRLKLRMKSDFN